ncbi:response regulator transcription factor [Nocardia tengchongensis]|uniref:response regulator transcription factor n=1 Tax=Nocardia tengchongensis TaxID=2055889 RepID=UPI00360B556B
MSQLPYSAIEFTSPPIAAGQPSKVLVVESNPAAAEIAVLVLANAGYEVISAGNAQRALTLAQRWNPDLVLLELALPDRPGSYVCRQLRKRSPIPIIVTSLDGDPDAIDDAYAAGACDYLPKPLRSGRLLDRIRVDLAAPPAVRGDSAA